MSGKKGSNGLSIIRLMSFTVTQRINDNQTWCAANAIDTLDRSQRLQDALFQSLVRICQTTIMGQLASQLIILHQKVMVRS